MPIDLELLSYVGNSLITILDELDNLFHFTDAKVFLFAILSALCIKSPIKFRIEPFFNKFNCDFLAISCKVRQSYISLIYFDSFIIERLALSFARKDGKFIAKSQL